MRPFLILFLLVPLSLFMQSGPDSSDTIPVKKDAHSAKVFTIVEQPAEFPGGMPALLRYLRSGMRPGTVSEHCGGCITIRLSFTVEKDGSTSHISVQDRHCCFSNIEVSLMQGFSAMPKWKPARMHGEMVRCYYTLPIRIRVN